MNMDKIREKLFNVKKMSDSKHVKSFPINFLFEKLLEKELQQKYPHIFNNTSSESNSDSECESDNKHIQNSKIELQTNMELKYNNNFTLKEYFHEKYYDHIYNLHTILENNTQLCFYDNVGFKYVNPNIYNDHTNNSDGYEKKSYIPNMSDILNDGGFKTNFQLFYNFISENSENAFNNIKSELELNTEEDE